MSKLRQLAAAVLFAAVLGPWTPNLHSAGHNPHWHFYCPPAPIKVACSLSYSK